MLDSKIAPPTLANPGQGAPAKAGAWTITTLVAVGYQLVSDLAGPSSGTVIEVMDNGNAAYDMTIENTRGRFGI